MNIFIISNIINKIIKPEALKFSLYWEDFEIESWDNEVNLNEVGFIIRFNKKCFVYNIDYSSNPISNTIGYSNIKNDIAFDHELKVKEVSEYFNEWLKLMGFIEREIPENINIYDIEIFTGSFVYKILVEDEATKYNLKRNDFSINVSTRYDDITGFSILLLSGGYFEVFYTKKYMDFADKKVFVNYNTSIYDATFSDTVELANVEYRMKFEEINKYFSSWMYRVKNTDIKFKLEEARRKNRNPIKRVVRGVNEVLTIILWIIGLIIIMGTLAIFLGL